MKGKNFNVMEENNLHSEEHNIGHLKDSENDEKFVLSNECKALKRVMSLSLKERVKNSIENEYTQEYSKFEVKNLY